MIAGLILLAGAAVVAIFGHRLLLRTSARPWCDPRFALLCWWLTTCSVVASAAVGVFLLTHTGHGGIEAVLDGLASCWVAIEHAGTSGWERGATIIGVVTLLLVATRFVRTLFRTVRNRQRLGERLRLLLTVADATRGRGGVRLIDHPRPVAFSVTGHPGWVAVSRGTTSVLSEAALAATVEHERAHLRRRHHLMIDIAETAGTVLRRLPLFRAAPAAVRELVELAADADAADRHGPRAVADALRSLTASGHVPSPGLGMAALGIAARIQRLETSARRPKVVHRLARYLLAALIPLSPVMLAGAAIVVLSCS
jgi:hypothetical protein